MHRLEIHDFGPIKSCEIDVNQFTVLTGSQASGKSTIAKTIYFFLTVKDVMRSYIVAKKKDTASFIKHINFFLSTRFRDIFDYRGYTDFHTMSMVYHYDKSTIIRVSNDGDSLSFTFSDDIIELLQSYENYYAEISEQVEELKSLNEKLNRLFAMTETPIYIPAGRSLITLLTDYLGELFIPSQTPEDLFRERNIDFCMRNYAKFVLNIRKLFQNGMQGLLAEQRSCMDATQKDMLQEAIRLISAILKGRYVYRGGEEFLQIGDQEETFLKISHASSGQQEILWVCNIIFYSLLYHVKTFMILEEPEAHLYPDSQKYISELIGLYIHAGNQVLVTTHSPYILGELNNLLYANEIKTLEEERDEIVDRKKLLPPDKSQAFFVNHGEVENAVENNLIKNELIDGASEAINEENDRLMELKWRMEDGHEY